MKLTENASKLHKSATVISSIILVVISILQIIQPYLSILEPVISPAIFPWVSAAMGIIIGIGRYIYQDLSDGILDGNVDGEEIKDVHDHEKY